MGVYFVYSINWYFTEWKMHLLFLKDISQEKSCLADYLTTTISIMCSTPNSLTWNILPTIQMFLILLCQNLHSSIIRGDLFSFLMITCRNVYNLIMILIH